MEQEKLLKVELTDIGDSLEFLCELECNYSQVILALSNVIKIAIRDSQGVVDLYEVLSDLGDAVLD